MFFLNQTNLQRQLDPKNLSNNAKPPECRNKCLWRTGVNGTVQDWDFAKDHGQFKHVAHPKKGQTTPKVLGAGSGPDEGVIKFPC